MKTIEVAQQAGFVFGMTEPVIMVRHLPQGGFERFADLIRADEREACAKVCDDWPIGREDVCEIAAFIRARGDK